MTNEAPTAAQVNNALWALKHKAAYNYIRKDEEDADGNAVIYSNQDDAEILRAHIAALKAENKRLRELSANVLRYDGGKGSDCYSALRLYDAREELQAALAQTGDK